MDSRGMSIQACVLLSRGCNPGVQDPGLPCPHGYRPNSVTQMLISLFPSSLGQTLPLSYSPRLRGGQAGCLPGVWMNLTHASSEFSHVCARPLLLGVEPGMGREEGVDDNWVQDPVLPVV